MCIRDSIYLVRTAEQKPDEALLSINSFQKDLAHANPRVRALALRVMSSIRVNVIVPVVILAVKKCALDPSPYVRKARSIHWSPYDRVRVVNVIP